MFVGQYIIHNIYHVRQPAITSPGFLANSSVAPIDDVLGKCRHPELLDKSSGGQQSCEPSVKVKREKKVFRARDSNPSGQKAASFKVTS